MEIDTVYSHGGVTYVRDWYTGETLSLAALDAKESAIREAYLATPEGQKYLAEVEAYQIAFKAKDAARAKKQKERIAAFAPIEQQIKELAFKLLETTEITESSYEDWRIANGYLWKVVSPKGKVYTETLKTLTVKDPKYLEGKSIEYAVAYKAQALAGYDTLLLKLRK